MKLNRFTDHGKWVVVLDNPEIEITLFQITYIFMDGDMCVLNHVDHDPINPRHLRFATDDEIEKWLETHNELTILNPKPTWDVIKEREQKFAKGGRKLDTNGGAESILNASAHPGQRLGLGEIERLNRGEKLDLDEPKPVTITIHGGNGDRETSGCARLGELYGTNEDNIKKRLGVGEHEKELNDMVEKFEYDMVNPSHYKNGSIETIEKMRRIWGNESTAIHCEMCAFKYRERMGSKPGNSIDQELKKIHWYEEKARELRESNDD